ncbi:helix-turn-helix domain-containing protein [Thermanaeromonas sp.]
MDFATLENLCKALNCQSGELWSTCPMRSREPLIA